MVDVAFTFADLMNEVGRGHLGQVGQFTEYWAQPGSAAPPGPPAGAAQEASS